ncbi:hypothetical protein GWI33_007264 [Rhynchophorus ferrugineus]|uniref:Uncharacterized protein n=1 Tax=Rhynchophorus ferrugineus TaxID=354439 RepID=A0A834MA77_RHYFE|nr:hypothetical protein GWI33_007264 [Rhynchophorus ferrugineus]
MKQEKIGTEQRSPIRPRKKLGNRAKTAIITETRSRNQLFIHRRPRNPRPANGKIEKGEESSDGRKMGNVRGDGGRVSFSVTTIPDV